MCWLAYGPNRSGNSTTCEAVRREIFGARAGASVWRGIATSAITSPLAVETKSGRQRARVSCGSTTRSGHLPIPSNAGPADTGAAQNSAFRF
jgi:hypothetical protein